MPDRRLRSVVTITAYALILAYCSVASSDSFGSFAPLSMSVTWLYASSSLMGMLMAFSFESTRAVFGGVVLVALLAALLFGATLGGAMLAGDLRLADMVAMYAFQSSLPRFLYICVLALTGTFFGMIIKYSAGSG